MEVNFDNLRKKIALAFNSICDTVQGKDELDDLMMEGLKGDLVHLHTSIGILVSIEGGDFKALDIDLEYPYDENDQ